jgi:hypothetical protein
MMVPADIKQSKGKVSDIRKGTINEKELSLIKEYGKRGHNA